MKHVVKTCVLASAMVASTTSFAAAGTSADQTNAQLRAQIESISKQTQALQQEVGELRAELHHRDMAQTAGGASHAMAEHTESQGYAMTIGHADVPETHTTPVPVTHDKSCHGSSACSHRTARHVVEHHLAGDVPFTDTFKYPITVTTSPYMGIRSAYDASDLLYFGPSVNNDLTLLQQRSDLVHQLALEGRELNRPVIELSGGVEGQIYSIDGFGQNPGDQGINLATSELDVHAIASDWASASFALDYDNSPAALGSRAPKGEIYLRRGAVTIGNLNVMPWYFSVGEMYAPFGQFSAAMLTTPVTQSLGRIRAPTALIGFYHNGFNAIVFGYDGFKTTGGTPVIKQGGARVGYEGHCNNVSYSLNVSGVTNIADSEGMQANGATLITTTATPTMPSVATNFAGFGVNTGGNALDHSVAGGDINGKLGVGNFTLLGEYDGAMERFGVLDMSFNGRGAKPQAMRFEGDYAFHIWHKPATFALAYGHTWQALALNLPENSYIALFSISFWKDTLETIEFRHDTDYAATDIAGGGGGFPGAVIPGSGGTVFVGNPGTGGSRNSVIGELGVYF